MKNDESSQLNRQIIESLSSGVLAVDAAGQILLANAAAAANLGLSDEALEPGARLDQLEVLAPLAALLEEIRAQGGSISRREVRLHHPDTTILGVAASPLKGPEPFNGVIFLFTDLTELRRLEQSAQLNRQLAQIGELTAGVVHELRNPLSVISGMGELLLRRLGERTDLAERVQVIVDEADDMDRLITQFLSFAKPPEISDSRCAPEEVQERALQLCERVAQERRVAIVGAKHSELPYIQADIHSLARAVGNVLRNAIEVTPPGGEVRLEMAADGAFLVFCILDTGPGIDLDSRDALFNPFYSRKEGGTGLGLSIVHRILDAHGGSIRYGNREGGGAWFELRVPVYDASESGS